MTPSPVRSEASSIFDQSFPLKLFFIQANEPSKALKKGSEGSFVFMCKYPAIRHKCSRAELRSAPS